MAGFRAAICLADLPGDIICELFMALADIDSPRRASSQGYARLFVEKEDSHVSLGWIRLTHVCRRLRNIGIELPTLWGRVVSIFPSAWETTLARARNAHLDLHLKDDGFSDYSHWPISADDLLARARTVRDIVRWNQPDTRSWWKGASPPHLENLQLRFRNYLSEPFLDPIRLLGLGQLTCPVLTSYTVYDGFIPFNIPSLRYLSIGYPVVWTTLVDSLHSCPLLETLSLKDARDPADPALSAAKPVELMHLTTFELTKPSCMDVVKLLDHLIIPASLKPEVQDCSPDLFHALIERYEKPSASDIATLNISAESIQGAIAIECAVNITQNTPATFQEYRVRPSSRIIATQTYSSFNHALEHLFQSAFAPSIAPSLRTLAIYSHPSAHRRSTATLSDPPSPLNASKSELERIGNGLRVFTGITTVYVQRESAPLLLAARDAAEKSAADTDMLFPSLGTIILDIFTSRLNISTWNGIVDFLLYRKADRRPLERLVLMGSHMCHLAPDEGGITKLKVDLRQVRGLVGEIVDMRGGKRCTCGIV